MSKFIMPPDRLDRVKIWQDQKTKVEQALTKVRIYQLELRPKQTEIEIMLLAGKDMLSEKSQLKQQEMNLRMEELALIKQKERLMEAIRGNELI